MLFGGPILIEGRFNVDLFDILVFLCPRQMAALDLKLYAHLRCRRNSSVHAQASVSGCGEKTEDVRALDWCPGPAIFLLQLYGLTSYKQHQLILQIWDIFHNDFLLVPDMSDMALN